MHGDYDVGKCYLTYVLPLDEAGDVPKDKLVGAGGEEAGLGQAHHQAGHWEGDNPAPSQRVKSFVKKYNKTIEQKANVVLF
jgi:hypothetical protein